MADAPSTGRETLRAQQLEQLRALIRAVRPANAFYETKLSAAGIDATASGDLLGAGIPHDAS